MYDSTILIDEVNDLCNEPTDGTGRWTDTQVLRKINFAQSEISLKVQDLLRTNATITCTASLATYTLPTNLGKIYQVYANGIPLNPKSTDSVNADLRADVTLNGLINTPCTIGYLTTYALENNTIILSPASNANGSVLTIKGELLLTDLTNSATSYPFENIPYLQKAQKILILFAAADLTITDGDGTKSLSLRQQGSDLLEHLESDWNIRSTPETHCVVVEKQPE